MANYPSLTAIPIYPLDESREDGTIRSPMEAGYEVTRARYTRVRHTWKVKYAYMSDTDKGTLDSFVTTQNGGADAFTWTHPVSTTQYSVRFREIPKYSYILNGWWDVEFTITEV